MPYSFCLIGESFQILFKNLFYLVRFWFFQVGMLLLVIMPLGVGLYISGVFSGVFQFSWTFAALGLISTILIIVYVLWASASNYIVIRSVVDDKILPFGTLAKTSWGQMGKIFMANLLSGLLIALGSILLIVPGVIFAVWFYFSAQVVLYENLGGRAALSRSKTLVKGHFWWLLKNLAIYTGLSLLLNLLLSYFLGSSPLPKDLQNLIHTPFSMVSASVGIVYSFLLYRDLVKQYQK